MVLGSNELRRQQHEVCTFAPGEIVYKQGDPAEIAYFVEEGRVRIFTRVGGLERNLRIVGTAGLFGDAALAPPSQYDGTAICVDRARVIAFDLGSLPGLVREAPVIGAKLVVRLAERAREAEERIEISMLRDSQLRVVVGLLRAARSKSAATEGPAALNITPLELSARVGLDVTAVKRAVHQLREAQYVQIIDERLTILDLGALTQLQGLLETGEEIQGGERR